MTAKDWQSVYLSKYTELLDYFGNSYIIKIEVQL